ncbi:hypothetical protein AVEN_273295-1 [Araneus ventricosus]|uniref:CCHC-type domain-containing protein n=1 Tax=Araneus ventricosus TaxID=182803 RepID=A0A4Y2MAN0_ARAVE|nr:hypothetical protein AVEN_273295-1 [Araneus ventricosus]
MEPSLMANQLTEVTIHTNQIPSSQILPPHTLPANHYKLQQLPTSYSILQNSSPSTRDPVNSTILLYPASDSNLSLPELLNETIPSNDINPVNIKSIRGNGLAVTLHTENEVDKLKLIIEENVTLKSAITSKIPSKRNPSIILYNLPSFLNEDEIPQALKFQHNLDFPLNPSFNFRGSSSNLRNWVFEAPAQILNSIKQTNKILIGWGMYRLSEFFHIKRCNFCQAFGHTTKECTLQVPSCGTCAGHHLTSNCQSSLKYCVNCYESNLYTGTDHQNYHSAKDRSCPFFQAAIQHYRTTRDYI